MPRIRHTPGLVTGFNLRQRCEKCDNPLENSKVNDILIAYRYCTRNRLLCIKCATHQTKHSQKSKITIDDVDRFLCNLLGDKN